MLAAAIALFGLLYYPVLRVQYREYRERDRLRAELAQIRARNARLEAEVARLRTPEGVEDHARTRLGLVRRGEHAVIVRDPSRPATRAPSPPVVASGASPQHEGLWVALLDLIFGVQ